jgi:hypothetical protein
MNEVKTKEEFEQDLMRLVSEMGLRATVALIHKNYSFWVLADIESMERCNPVNGQTLRNHLDSDVEFLERHIDLLEDILFTAEIVKAYLAE